jgi:hypothetical protein
MRNRNFIIPVCCMLLIGIFPSGAGAWTHEGHVLITRLAALRIINDAAAPQGLRNFLARNMTHTLADCRALALEETIGLHVENFPQYDRGLEHWATMPDQIRLLPEGKTKIAPYGASEGEMHYLDLEVFGKTPAYRDDLSARPDVESIPRDLTDPRWKRSGYLPWRVEEMYRKLAAQLAPLKQDEQRALNRGPNEDNLLQAAGYLAHYIEDARQPHHATMDFNSVSYLIGHIPQLPATTRPDVATLEAMRLPAGVNPHLDLELQLFANAKPPLDDFRKQYWNALLKDIDAFAVIYSSTTQPAMTESFDPFRWNLRILSDSYNYLPLIGHAAQAAYANGTFDPKAFFPFEGQVNNQRMTIIQLIARQNALAVLDVEHAYRLAWMERDR